MTRPRTLVLLGLAFCLLAGAFAASALYVPGIALLLLVGGAEAGVRASAWRARLERAPDRATAVEGDPIHLELRVAGLLARRAGRLRRWPGAAPEAVPRAARRALALEPQLTRRGLHVIGPSVLELSDPLGIASRTLASPATEVLVLPRIDEIPAGRLALVGAGGRDARTPRREREGAEADGLRPYREGAPATRIHWRSVARTGTLVERHLSGEADRHALVVLDARAPASADALDMCVRAAASLCVALARLEGCALLLPGEQRAHFVDSTLSAWPPLHARLALLGPGASVARTAVERAPTVLWVGAGGPPRSLLGRLGGRCYVVSPLSAGGPRVLFTVAGCAVRALAGGARRAA
ncbi:MAG TPA: DUF58 domain-containing protein [Solirubrobacteraceae bacterium]|nr:DUF58 domain-containing protein [Solirubrobacteraceae bacterium]